ncbi:hypothetical protein [Nitrosospira briensis]|uniref:hypothetical protein n=1 Tax=Nitrosospira briensis TaxID=35799 RepID=UPI0008E5FAD1|nr:hypothetical protein [Nitrosospira briensis]SFO31313.1 hypothetical protein SAMN05216332_110104 [Nitrosospira briensis]
MLSTVTRKKTLEVFETMVSRIDPYKVYARAAVEFATWCGNNGLTELHDIALALQFRPFWWYADTRASCPPASLHA